MTLFKNISYSINSLKNADKDRYLSTLFLSKDKRDALITLYAFNVEIAKIAEVTTEKMAGFIRLQWWRETIEGIKEGKSRKHPIVEDLIVLINEYDLPFDLFLTLIEGRELDIEGEKLKTFQDLLFYIDKTSTALMKLAMLICDIDNEVVSKSLGQSWALTGLIRALPYQIIQDKIFIPEEFIETYGLNIDKKNIGKETVVTKIIKALIVEIDKKNQFDLRDLKTKYNKNFMPFYLQYSLIKRYVNLIESADFDVFSPRYQAHQERHIFFLFKKYIKYSYFL